MKVIHLEEKPNWEIFSIKNQNDSNKKLYYIPADEFVSRWSLEAIGR